MAIYHATLKVFSRAKGHCATAAVAYRAGIRLTDERTGVRHDYARRKGVAAVETLVPDQAPAWARDLATLWNAAEAAESRSNARVARELEVALPYELNADQRLALARELAQLLVDRYGVGVTAAVHAPDQGNDARNHHLHALFTTRVLTTDGFGAKVRILDDKVNGPLEVHALRAAVAATINHALKRAGIDARVDSRTLDDQAADAAARGDLMAVVALTRSPTKHLGRATAEARRRGRPTDRGSTHDALVRANENTVRHARRRALYLLTEHPGKTTHRSGSRSSGYPAGRRLSSMYIPDSIGTRHAGTETNLYLRSLQQTVAWISENFRRALISEQRLQELQRWCDASVRNRSYLRRVWQARDELIASEQALERADKRHKDALAKTRQAQSHLSQLEESKPSLLRPMSRRQWAEKRREQRRQLAEAQSAEHTSSKTLGKGSDLHQAVATARTRIERRWNALCEAEAKSHLPPVPEMLRQHSTSPQETVQVRHASNTHRTPIRRPR